ncbi:MAG: glycosyltransferase family 39 protein [Patescibacteria group bacterium]
MKVKGGFRFGNIGLLLLVSLILRIVLMNWSFQHTLHKDIFRFRDWAMIPYVHNLTDPYEGKHITFGIDPLNLPPATLYIVTSMYRVNILAAKVIGKITHTDPGALQWVNIQLTNAFLRLPNFIADLLTGYLIYAIVRKYKDEKKALFASSLYLFNPSILYNGAFWGQMDAINNALFFLGVCLFLYHKKLLSIIALFLSLYVKLTLIVLIGPLLGAIIWFDKEKKKIMLYSIFSIALILVMTLPISLTPHLWFWEFFQKNSLGEMNNITSLAFNFWWVIFKPRIEIGQPITDFLFTQDRFVGSPESTMMFWGLSLFTWAILLFAVVSIPLMRAVMRLKEKIWKPEVLFMLLSLLSLVGYLFLPHMHERYLFAFFPLMAVSIGLTQKHSWLFMLISLLNFLNLYIVWHPMIHPSLPYDLMNSVDFQWFLAVATVALGILLYIRSVKYIHTIR